MCSHRESYLPPCEDSYTYSHVFFGETGRGAHDMGSDSAAKNGPLIWNDDDDVTIFDQELVPFCPSAENLTFYKICLLNGSCQAF